MRDYGLGYGLGDASLYMEGSPTIHGEAPVECPNCRCAVAFRVEVVLKDYPMLKPGLSHGTYFGCAACPWASPMLITQGDKYWPGINDDNN